MIRSLEAGIEDWSDRIKSDHLRSMVPDSGLQPSFTLIQKEKYHF